MNRTEPSEADEDNGSSSARPKKLGKKTAGGVAVLVLLGAYSVAQPLLNQRLGWNLPALRQDANGQIVADNPGKDDPGTVDRAGSVATKQNKQNAPTKSSQPTSDRQAQPPTNKQPSAKTKSGPLADRLRPNSPQDINSTRGSPQPPKPAEELRYGLLRDIGGQRYLSPAGLQYGRGSQEGHRLEHLRRHTKDIPNRKGSHGVFDGEMEGALKTIDAAYQRAKRGQSTTKQSDGERTIYTIDMGKRIGFVGGETGQRKRNPMARRVRLVLDGTSVITAYPL